MRKSANWALRQIGKRNPELRLEAIATALRLLEIDTPATRWIARDALRELNLPEPARREVAGKRSRPAAAK